MRIVERVESVLAAEEVWPRMADFSRTAEWDPGIAAVDRLDEGPVRVGTRYRVHVRMGPLVAPMAYEVVALEARRVVLRGVGALIRAVDDIRVEDRPGGGSVVVWTAELTPRGPLALTEPLWRPAFRQVAAAAMAGLARWLA